LRIAAVTVVRVVVVATFARIQDAVAATHGNALVRIERRVAVLAHGTVRIGIASTRVIRWIAELARALRRARAGLANFLEARAVATVAVRRIAVVATFAGFQHEVATTRIHANVRICNRIAELSHWTISIHVASAGVVRRVAETARALHRTRAGLTDFLEARRVTTVAVRRIAVVATFGRFHDEVATARIHANVRIRNRIAQLTTRTIRILVTSARVIGDVAEAARALRIERAGLPDFPQTHRRAAVTVRRIAVVASFAGFENVVATAWIHAEVRVCHGVAKLHAGTIGILVASANAARRITEGARALRINRTGLTKLEQTHGIAAVTSRRIAVVATFGRFHDEVATSRRDALIRIGHRIAQLTTRTIRILVTSA